MTHTDSEDNSSSRRLGDLEQTSSATNKMPWFQGNASETLALNSTIFN
jgi:hypothetical protein